MDCLKSTKRRINFVKHSSAPFPKRASLSSYSDENCRILKPQIQNSLIQQPFDDISNRVNKNNPNVDYIKIKDNFDKNDDDLFELEQVVFEGNIASSDFHRKIKESLELEASCVNLIGDHSKQHLLPLIKSNKHHDLQCISPQTVPFFFLSQFQFLISLQLINFYKIRLLIC